MENAPLSHQFFIKNEDGTWKYRGEIPLKPISWKDEIRERAQRENHDLTEVEQMIDCIESMLRWENRPAAEEILLHPFLQIVSSFSLSRIDPSLRKGKLHVGNLCFSLYHSSSALKCLHLLKADTYSLFYESVESGKKTTPIELAIQDGSQIELIADEEGFCIIQLASPS